MTVSENKKTITVDLDEDGKLSSEELNNVLNWIKTEIKNSDGKKVIKYGLKWLFLWITNLLITFISSKIGA